MRTTRSSFRQQEPKHRGTGLKARFQWEKKNIPSLTSTGTKLPIIANGLASVFPPRRNGRKRHEAALTEPTTAGETTQSIRTLKRVFSHRRAPCATPTLRYRQLLAVLARILLAHSRPTDRDS